MKRKCETYPPRPPQERAPAESRLSHCLTSSRRPPCLRERPVYLGEARRGPWGRGACPHRCACPRLAWAHTLRYPSAGRGLRRFSCHQNVKKVWRRTELLFSVWQSANRGEGRGHAKGSSAEPGPVPVGVSSGMGGYKTSSPLLLFLLTYKLYSFLTSYYSDVASSNGQRLATTGRFGRANVPSRDPTV